MSDVQYNARYPLKWYIVKKCIFTNK